MQMTQFDNYSMKQFAYVLICSYVWKCRF